MNPDNFQTSYNPPPKDFTDFFLDKHGYKVWFQWDGQNNTSQNLWVYYRENLVAVMVIRFKETDILLLDDIVIFEAYIHLRNRGIGKGMLQLAVEKARAAGAKYIQGFLAPHDGVTSNYLIEWYERQEFEVFEFEPGSYLLELEL
jgi:ribosomal protein S18 acetylase RimI-like enzyme